MEEGTSAPQGKAINRLSLVFISLFLIRLDFPILLMQCSIILVHQYFLLFLLLQIILILMTAIENRFLPKQVNVLFDFSSKLFLIPLACYLFSVGVRPTDDRGNLFIQSWWGDRRQRRGRMSSSLILCYIFCKMKMFILGIDVPLNHEKGSPPKKVNPASPSSN